MLKELNAWASLSCLSRKARAGARNVIDCRWVYKYKWEAPTTNALRVGQQKYEPVKSIRARLAIRGFRDADRNEIDRYAGTSSRASQKLLVSEAVRRGWIIHTTDISKAFLQGVT